MSLRVTKFGVEILGRAYPPVIADPASNTVFPLISESNWRGEFGVETIWQTAISRSQSTGAEEREGLVTRPTRILNTLISGLDRTETTRMLANAFSMAGSNYPAAIYSDYTIAITASTSNIECETHHRRLFPGQRVAVLPSDYSLRSDFTQAQLGVIATVTADGITLVDPLAVSCAIGDIILPLVDARISLSQELDAITDGVAEWEQVCIELSGASTLPALAEEDARHLGFVYYLGYPVFRHNINWRDDVKVGVARDGSVSQSGTTEIATPDGSAAYFTFAASIEEYDRKTVWNTARFFDSRRGRLHPFWAANPLVLFEVTSVVATSPNGIIRVKAATSSAHLTDMIEHVSISYVTGAQAEYAIDTMSDEAGGVIEITLLGAIETDAIEELTSLHLCRFDQDNLKQAWITDQVCKFELAWRSLLDEGTYQVTP